MPVAVSPSIPTESSTAAPGGKFSDWFKNIGDWIKSLSPAGATQYDTDWQSTGLTITPSTDWTVSSYAVRRVGMVAYVRLTLTYTGAGLTTNSSGDVADSNMVTLPAGWRPSNQSAPVSVSQNGGREWFGQASPAGIVILTHGLPSQTLTTGTVITVRGMYFAA